MNVKLVEVKEELARAVMAARKRCQCLRILGHPLNDAGQGSDTSRGRGIISDGGNLNGTVISPKALILTCRSSPENNRWGTEFIQGPLSTAAPYLNKAIHTRLIDKDIACEHVKSANAIVALEHALV